MIDVTGYRTANSLLNTTDVALAAPAGDTATAGTSVTNQSPDGFSKALDTSIGTASAGFTARSNFTGIASGGTDTASLFVGVDTTVAGIFTASAGVDFTSSGVGTTEAADLDIGSGSVALSGKVYEAAPSARIHRSASKAEHLERKAT